MWNWISKTLREPPEIALFLAIALAYPLGYRGFTLGMVATTLRVGLLIGQLDIEISQAVGSVFFLLFRFAIGYGVGPRFVRGLRRDGASQARAEHRLWCGAVCWPRCRLWDRFVRRCGDRLFGIGAVHQCRPDATTGQAL
ncbi:hypothetical protein FHS55_003364 [Angulomicrobium tetraedrale]|uniref:YidE/YbjL duplication domain-containing protein n=1 Tax=Ancylobacter tetraedralis TaxID=217068 RepID=A0A839ZD75_9HYPH|nr:hypothetical protein [Ancylobacter tetraedralis]MBB3772743.1 hypothetical protein [Ancylobacter tetraedralis]